MAGVCLGAVSAHATDGTWVGGSGSDWLDPTSWSSNPLVPDGVATFTNMGGTTVTTSGFVSIGEVDFTAVPNAPSYTINEGDFFIVNAAGVFNNSTNTQTFNVSTGMVFEGSSTASGGTMTVTYDNSGVMSFLGTSTAGNATIVNNNTLQFNNSSNAGTAIITNNLQTDFFDSSSAGSANITNAAFALITFNSNATASTATIGNSGGVQFNDQSTAGSATITNATGATITFNGTSTAGNANISITGTTVTVTFNNSSSAGNATFTANPATFGTITFNDTSTAGSANIQLVDTNLTFNNSSTAGSAIITMPNVMHPGNITFNDTSSAGNANITNVAVTTLGTSVQFLGASTAGSATITNNPNSSVPGEGGVLNFGTLGGTDTANAGTATIINNQFGSTSFLASTSAMNATITNNNGGNTNFQDTSHGANAIIVNNNGGTTNFGIPVVGTDMANAENASITNNGGTTNFNASTNAGSASITNNSGGTTNFGDSARAGSATITTNSGGSVFFFNSSTGDSARFITNAGGIFNMSGLTSAGMTAGSIEGAGSYILGSKLLTVGSNNLSTTVSGVISGVGGSLVKVGTGTLTLTGANTYTGPTNVNGGILSVDGSLVSVVTVNNGGTLMGNGTIGGLNVASGGIVAPGHSIGQINVNGNVMFGAGSIYQVEVNAAGANDKIVATGTATLTGGTVQTIAASGVYGLATKYTILTATGGVTGTFANVTSNQAFLTPSLSYDADDVFLTLTRNASAFSTIAQTFNQRAVAGALDASPFGSTLVQAILPLSVPQALQAFDALSGEIHGSLQTALIDDSRYIRGAILGRLRTAGYAGAGGGMAPLAFGGPEMTMNGAQAAIAAAAPTDGALAYGMVTKAPVYKAPPAYDPDLTFWAQGYGAWGRYDSDGNAARMERSAGGAFVGVDRRFADIWRLGFAAGYSRSDISVDARASSADIDTFHAAVYAGAVLGPWSLRTGAAMAWHDIDTSRAIIFPGLFDTAQASYHGSTSQVFGEVGYGMAFGQVAVEPFAGMAYVHLETNGFSEIGNLGGSSALTGNGNSADVGFSSLGVRLATSVMLGNGMMVIPRVSAAWQHAFGDLTPSAVLAFQSTGVAFDIHGVPLARDSALVEAGFDVKVAPKVTLGIAYTGELSSSVQDNAVKGKFTWNF